MKKTLLLATVALAAGTSFANKADNANFPVKNGITCENLWLNALNYGNYNKEASDIPFIQNDDFDRSRTMAILGDEMLIGYSHKIEQNGELNSGTAHIIVLDLYTGKYKRTIQPTVDGKTVDDLLASNQIGVDDFGHVWFTPYRNSLLLADGNPRPINIYVVDNMETGESHIAFTVTLPDAESEYGDARVDFFDIVGDVTGKEAGTVIMTAGCENSPEPFVCGWQRDQGSDKFEPHMSGYSYVAQNIADTYPAGQTLFSYGSDLYISRDDEHSGELYYVDGFTTVPCLYDTEGTLLDGMQNLDDTNAECLPKPGANGVVEFTLGGDVFIAYPLGQYSDGLGAQFAVCKMGDGAQFTGMELLWALPSNGNGTITDGGIRLHDLQVKYEKDANGKEAVVLGQFRCKGGVGAYRIAQEGFEAGVNDVIADDVDVNAPVEYFNVLGQGIDNPAAGQLVIKRQGNKVEKMVVR